MADVTTPAGPPTTAQTGYGSGQAAGGNGQADGAADQARDKAQEAAGQAKDKAQEAKSKASDKVREQVGQRSTQAGEQVSTTANDLRSVSEQLREQGKDTPARLAEQAAERTEQVGNYLRDSDPDRILGDVEDFARRQPWAVVAGGLVLGFAASRFVKASSSDRYQSGSSEQTAVRGPQPTTPRAVAPAVDGDGYSQAAVPPPVSPGATIPPR
jgi:uncharacterized protein YjbJ (UPF0337 family)